MGGPLSGDCFWRVSATLLSVTILLYIPYYYVGRWMAPVKRKAEPVTPSGGFGIWVLRLKQLYRNATYAFVGSCINRNTCC